MDDTERKQIKPQLLKCAKENENNGTFTGHVIVSSVCRAAVERIEELEKENEELRNNGFTVSAMTEQQLKVALEKGEQLEKENAELKGLKDVATLIRANNDTVITLMQLNNKLVSKSQQITKAEEKIVALQKELEERKRYEEKLLRESFRAPQDEPPSDAEDDYPADYYDGDEYSEGL